MGQVLILIAGRVCLPCKVPSLYDPALRSRVSSNLKTDMYMSACLLCGATPVAFALKVIVLSLLGLSCGYGDVPIPYGWAL